MPPTAAFRFESQISEDERLTHLRFTPIYLERFHFLRVERMFAMRIGRVICVILMTAVAACSMRAQPEKELRDAIDQLLRAGNYSWEQKLEIGLGARSPRPLSIASGETVIGGYSRARIGRVHVVMFDRKLAFVLRDGWRHGDDLTVNDIAELHSPGTPAKSLNHAHPLPHELLEILDQAARNIRKESGAIVAEIDPTILDAGMLERYLRTGDLPVEPPTRTVLGLPLPGSSRSRSSPASVRSGEHVNFSIWEQAGKITRLSLEFLRPTRVLNGPKAGDRDKLRSAYIFDVFEIGTTNVDIPPEAKALFLNATAGR